MPTIDIAVFSSIEVVEFDGGGSIAFTPDSGTALTGSITAATAIPPAGIRISGLPDTSGIPAGSIINSISAHATADMGGVNIGTNPLIYPSNAFFSPTLQSGGGVISGLGGTGVFSPVETLAVTQIGYTWPMPDGSVNGLLADFSVFFLRVDYSLPAPELDSISPVSGPVAGGTPFTLTGSFFAATPTVTFDGVLATSVVFVNATTVTGVTPAHAAGAVDVVLTNPDMQTSTLSAGFLYINLAPPSTTLPVAGQWRLQRFDLKPRGEQTS